MHLYRFVIAGLCSLVVILFTDFTIYHSEFIRERIPRALVWVFAFLCSIILTTVVTFAFRGFR